MDEELIELERTWRDDPEAAQRYLLALRRAGVRGEAYVDALQHVVQAALHDVAPGVELGEVSLGPASAYWLVVPGEVCLDAWSALRGMLKRTGHWPLLLEQGSEPQALLAASKQELPVADVLTQANAPLVNGLSPTQREGLERHLDWLAGQAGERFRSAEAQLRARLAGEPAETHVKLGEWPSEDPTLRNEIVSPLTVVRTEAGLERAVSEQVLLGLMPSEDPWEAPAWLRFGDWEDCPHPEIHVRRFREWHEHYAAEPVAMVGDVVEFAVARPPTTREEALALAREHVEYCPDRVSHEWGGTLRLLASELVNAQVWFFRWARVD